jgi:hypothetical protein
MQDSFERVDASLISIVFAIAMLASWFLGWQRGRRFPSLPGDDPDAKFIDASVVLLGLLLAFTFSMALQGHDQRRSAVVAESNAISDFYTCATLLKEPRRSELQVLIGDYARQLVKLPFEELTTQQEKEENQRCLQAYSQMTAIVDKADADGTPIALALVNTLNNVASTNALRAAAYHIRTPWSIAVLLFVAAVVPAFLIGEKQGARGKIHLSGSLSFVVIVTAVIFVTLDLDQPHRGMIKVSRESLERVVHSMDR